MVPQQADTARTMRERFEKINQSPHADKQGLREDPRVHHQNKLKIISIIPQAIHIHTTLCVSRIAQRLRLLLSVPFLRLCGFVCFISAPCWCYGFTDCELCLKVISHPCIHHCLTTQRNTADVGLSSLLSQVANPRFVDTGDLPSVTCPNQRRHHPQFSRTAYCC